MYHYSYPGSLQIIATQRNYALWFPDMFFSAWSGSKWLWPHDVKSKPSKIHCDLQKALGPQGAHQPHACLVHMGKQLPLHHLQRQGLPQVSITHHPSPGFLVLEVLSPAQAAVSPAQPACAEGGERSHRVVTCASSPLAPSIPGILSNTFHCDLMEWGEGFCNFYLIRRVSYWSFLFYGLLAMTSCGRHNVSVVQEELSPCQQKNWGSHEAAGSCGQSPSSRHPFQSSQGMPWPVSPPQCAHWDIPAPATAGRRGGTLESMGLSCNTFFCLSVTDVPSGAYFDHTCIRGMWECSAEKVEKDRGWDTVGCFWQWCCSIPSAGSLQKALVLTVLSGDGAF